ncbi:patched domain-containing protein 3-like isoform X2 [Argopecten irradians]|uniref:patched domain-containing protein 3-like isoform X2 n=1 Tax=Argopecten irradians TaxID=31199 RepID=UPI003723C6F6
MMFSAAKLEDSISGVFGRYGKVVSKYPWGLIMTCILVNGLLGVNIQWVTSDSDLGRVYTPTNSQAKKDREHILSIFPDSSGTNFYRQSMDSLGFFGEIIFKPRYERNALERNFQNQLKNILKTARATFVLDIDNNIFNYEDLCAKRNGQCVVDGECLLDSTFWDILENGSITKDVFDKEDYSFVIGTPTFVNDTLQSAPALKFRLNLRQDSSTFSTLSAKWETKFLETLKNMKLNDSDIAYQISDSLNTELDANTGGDVTYFSLTFTLMITNASFVAAGGNCVSNRGHLGRAGIISAGMAILGSFGLMSACHVDFVNIVGVMPFLIIATAVGFCYLNQITFFLGCMALHERRVAANRHCITCSPIEFPTENNQSDSTATRVCCTGSPAKSRNEQESMFEKIPRLVIPRMIINVPAKVLIFISYLAYLGFAIFGVTHLHQGLILQNLVSDSSYYYQFSQWDFDYFPSNFPISFVIPNHQNYSSIHVLDKLDSILKLARNYIDIEDTYELNWLTSYQNSTFFANKTENDFTTGLHRFLNNSKVFKNDVVFNPTPDQIEASRFFVMSNNIKDSYTQGKLMLQMREIASNSVIPCFAYSPSFIFFEQYVAVLPSTLQTVGIAVAAVFVVACVLMPNPFLIICIALSLASIITGVLGFMHFWGLSLSSITMIHVIMSVGFSVDFSAHICHAFLTSEGRDRNARVCKALEMTAGPIFNSAVSSIVGIIMLILSESYVFISFFRVMLLVILFGLFHGLFVLPIVFSLVGPTKPMKGNVRLFTNNIQNHKKEKTGTYNRGFELDFDQV